MRSHPIWLALRYLKGRKTLRVAPYYGRPLFGSEAEAIEVLKRFTHQNFGSNVAAWSAWVRANRWIYTDSEGAQPSDGSPPRIDDAWRRYVEREGLVSAMNATRWREATEAMRDFSGGSPGFRIKDIEGPEPGLDVWDREWHYHPRPWETIEWLELQPDPRHDAIIRVLQQVGVPITIEDGRIRIWGWLRPGVSPDWI